MTLTQAKPPRMAFVVEYSYLTSFLPLYCWYETLPTWQYNTQGLHIFARVLTSQSAIR